MKINEIKSCFKIADASLTDVYKEKFGEKFRVLKFNYLNKFLYSFLGSDRTVPSQFKIPETILTDNVARLYFIVSNGEIVKIGASNSEGGMRSTLYIYQDGGVLGKPSLRSFGVYTLIKRELEAGKKIEFYMSFVPDVSVQIPTIDFADQTIKASISSFIVEEHMRQVVVSKDATLPAWNHQESGQEWDQEITEMHRKINVNSRSKK